jgi:hypothetical protein
MSVLLLFGLSIGGIADKVLSVCVLPNTDRPDVKEEIKTKSNKIIDASAYFGPGGWFAV